MFHNSFVYKSIKSFQAGDSNFNLKVHLDGLEMRNLNLSSHRRLFNRTFEKSMYQSNAR